MCVFFLHILAHMKENIWFGVKSNYRWNVNKVCMTMKWTLTIFFHVPALFLSLSIWIPLHSTPAVTLLFFSDRARSLMRILPYLQVYINVIPFHWVCLCFSFVSIEFTDHKYSLVSLFFACSNSSRFIEKCQKSKEKLWTTQQEQCMEQQRHLV